MSFSVALLKDEQQKFVRPANLDNFVFKSWLQHMGSPRRRVILKKLKNDLQKLGLSQRRVRRGLIQIATKTRVVLTRLPNDKNRRTKTLETEKCEEVSGGSPKIPFIEKQQEIKDVQEFAATRKSNKTNELKPDSDNEIVVLDRTQNVSDISIESHAFETALTQIDQVFNSKMGVSRKSSTSKISMAVLADTTSMSHNKDSGINKENVSSNKDTLNKKSISHRTEAKGADIKNQSDCAAPKVPELVADIVGKGPLHIPVKIKRNQIKLNLKTLGHTKDASTLSASVDIKSVAKERTDIFTTDINVKSKSFEKMCSINKEEKCAKSIESKDTCPKVIKRRKRQGEAITTDYTQKKKMTYASIKGTKEITVKRRKRIEERFRMYFGECITGSEDEEEKHIMKKLYKPANSKECIFNENTSSNCIGIIKEIQMAVPDSTMEECNEEERNTKSMEDGSSAQSKEVTCIESESITETTTTGIVELLRGMCEADTVRIQKEEVEKKLLDTGTTKVMKVCQNTEELKITTTSRMEEGTAVTDVAEKSIDAQKISKAHDGHDGHDDQTVPIFNLDLTEILKQSSLSAKDDLSELLRMKLDEAYQIAFNGNVISIPENICTDANQNFLNKPTNESIDSRIPSEVQLKSSHDVNREEQIESNVTSTIMPNNLNECNGQEDNEVSTIDNNICCGPNNTLTETKKDSQEIHSTKENEDVQPSTHCQIGRLRVLSSKELGSRWCPTPVCTTIASDAPEVSPAASTVSDIPLKSTNAEISPTQVSQAVPVIVSVTPALTFTPLESTQTSSDNERNTDTCSDQENKIDTAVNNIIESIKYNRSVIRLCRSQQQSVNDDKSTQKLIHEYWGSVCFLLRELETIGKLKCSTSYKDVVNCIVDIINKRWSESPTSYKEIAEYVPDHFSTYYSKSSANATVGVSSSTTTSSNQYLQNNPQISSSTPPVNARVTQIRLGSTKPATENKRTARPYQRRTSAESKRQSNLKNNVQRGTGALPQTALPRNNTPMNFGNTHNTQQMNFAPQMAQTNFSQKPAYLQFVGNKPMTQSSEPLQQTCTFIPVPVVQYVSLKTGDHASTMNIPVPNPYTQQGMHTPQATRTELPVLRQLVQQTMSIPLGNTAYNPNVPTGNPESQRLTYQKETYNGPVGTCQPQNTAPLSQGVHQTVPMVPQYSTPHPPNYVSQTLHYPPPIYQVRTNNVPQKQGIPQYMPANNVFGSEKILLPQHMTQNRSCHVNTPQTAMQPQAAGTKILSVQNVAQSMRYEWKDLTILKYYTDSQKAILMKQIQFYINCSEWLQQHVPNFKPIQSTMVILSEFQRVLNNHLQKARTNLPQQELHVPLEQTKCIDVTNTSTQETQKTQESPLRVQSNEVSAVSEEQSKLINTDKLVTTYQESLSTVVQEPSGEMKECEDKSPNTRAVELTQELEETPGNVKENDVLQRDKNEAPSQKLKEQIYTNLEEKNPELAKDVSMQDIRKPPKQCMLRRYLETTSWDENQKNKEIVEESSKSIFDPQRDAVRAPDPGVQREILSPQPAPVLVTVEVSTSNDQVKVIATNIICASTESIAEKNDEKKTEECRQSIEDPLYHDTVASPLLSGSDVISEVSTSVSCDTIVLDTDETMSEGSVTHIADVRSIPLDVFEKMGDSDCTTNNDGEFEEEESKVCLNCSKKSTVVCPKCWQAQYCSVTCAEIHWNDHYNDCKSSKHAVYTEFTSPDSLSKDLDDSKSVL